MLALNGYKKGMDIDGEAAGDRSGHSLAMSEDGNIVVIGANRNNGNGAESGHVRVFEFNGTGWIQKGADIDGEFAGDRSGTSVTTSADGSVIAIGAIRNDANGSNSGHVRVYKWDNNAWIQKGLDLDGEAAVDYFWFFFNHER